MNIRIILVLFLVFSFLITGLAFAELKEARFENKHALRLTSRSDDDDYDLYLTRVQGYIDYRIPEINRIIRLAPFFEYQFNLDSKSWWRKELGVEIGSFFFNDCFYYGASLQSVWQKEENYTVELLDDTFEWESRFVIIPPIPWGIFKDKERVNLYFFDEYTYDLTRGQATINEVGVTLEWQAFKWLKIPIGWRHTDRIHDFDWDMLEFSLLFSF